MRTLALNEARAKFSQVVDDALAGEPQRVTRYGKDAVVIISEAEWNRRNPGFESLGALIVDAARRGVFNDLELDNFRGQSTRQLGEGLFEDDD